MADIIKIKAKQLDMDSIEAALNASDSGFISKENIDTELTENSQNLVTSGAVYTALDEKASLDSPTFTGTVILPPVENETGEENLKAATVGYVLSQMESYTENIENKITSLDGGEI